MIKKSRDSNLTRMPLVHGNYRNIEENHWNTIYNYRRIRNGMRSISSFRCELGIVRNKCYVWKYIWLFDMNSSILYAVFEHFYFLQNRIVFNLPYFLQRTPYQNISLFIYYKIAISWNLSIGTLWRLRGLNNQYFLKKNWK